MDAMMLEAGPRRDGRLALFNGDEFVGHVAAMPTKASHNGTTPERPADPMPRKAKSTRSKGRAAAQPVKPTARLGAAEKEALQAKARRLHKQGKTLQEIADATGVKYATVWGWRKQGVLDGDEADGGDDAEDDPAPPAHRGRSPPRSLELARRPRRLLSEQPLPARDDDETPVLHFTDAGRVMTEGLDLEAIDQVVAEAVRGGRIPEDPARRMAMEMWDDGVHDLAMIADACQVAPSTVQYWHSADDWECRRGRRLQQTA